jgi:quercetin dioxygenase-like cupin family protein
MARVFLAGGGAAGGTSGRLALPGAGGGPGAWPVAPSLFHIVIPGGKTQHSDMPFATLASLPPKSIFNGTIRGHYTHLGKMTFGEVELDAGTDVPMHEHPHEQMTYVLNGRFQFTVGDRTAVLEPGMIAIIPGGTKHGGRTLTARRVIDVFAPAREDYR